jgi:GT2 family glycosyltransferase
MIAKGTTWLDYSYDAEHVFNPAHRMTENEVELQIRWASHGLRRAVVPSSFVFHYRGVSRGLQGEADGAYRVAQ